MLQSPWFDQIVSWVGYYQSNLVWSGILFLSYFVLIRLALPLIEKSVVRSKFKSVAVTKAYHTTRLIIGILTVALLLIVWGIDFSGLLIISTSLLTLTGVALFASWSLLSNVTSYFVLLIQPSFQRGNFVRVIDADNYIEGYISEVNMFNSKLITEDREVIVYPNNLLLTRPTIINPRVRLTSVGKIPLHSEASTRADEDVHPDK